MGCSEGDKECYEDEHPAHTVQISTGFWLTQTEITVAAFQLFGNAKGVAVPPKQVGNKYPVMAVLWDEASAYCAWPAGGCRQRRSGSMQRALEQQRSDTAISMRLPGPV
jgi:formylglycine-generating enzyme required for sulfatase activity